ncbi:MAG: hypothetical protein AB1715_11300, partial [Acidobacteriota bacterium]
MKNKAVWAVLFFFILTGSGSAGIGSLSHLFFLGKGLLDQDRDGLADKIAFCIVVPDNPSAAELALAADISARANFESLCQDMDLVKRQSQARTQKNEKSRILIGTKTSLARELGQMSSLPALGPNQGAILLLGDEEPGDLAVTAGSDEALLKTGQAFFLRWPYLWEVWGREDGITYFTVEENLERFLKEAAGSAVRTVLRAAFYDFPELASPVEAVKRLRFDSGEIKDLWVEIHFSDGKNKEKAEAALAKLAHQHRRGERTDTLSFPGCGQVTFILREGGRESRLILSRVGYPKRMLTPGYKDPGRRNVPEKDFDLMSLFSAQGLYSDSDQDGLLDGLDSLVIIPSNLSLEALAPLASRLVLPTTGASFPIVRFENKVEDIKTVTAPILLGDGRFFQELIKTGKLKLPALEPGWAAAQVITKAFNKSNCLALLGADSTGLEKITRYFSLDFPYLSENKEGAPQIGDIAADLEKFLKGEKGTAEAYLQKNLTKIAAELKDRELEYFRAEVYLPEENSKFIAGLRAELQKFLRTPELKVEGIVLKENKVLFEKEREFGWEADDGLSILEDKIATAADSPDQPIKISLGVSESPAVRQKIKARIEERLRQKKYSDFEVEVGSSY